MVLGSLVAGVGLIMLGWARDIAGMFVVDPSIVSGIAVFLFSLLLPSLE